MSKDTRYRLKLIELDGVTCVSVKKSGKHYCAWKGEEPKGKFTHIYKDPKKKKFEFTKKLIAKYNEKGLEPPFLERESRIHKTWH